MLRATTAALALLLILLFCSPNLAEERNSSVALAAKTILAEQLQRHVDVLADDTFEGREAGSRGGHAAGVYLHKYFAQHNLIAAGDQGDYFQVFGNGMRNILGILEGSDLDLKNELILVGAHYDHVGYGSRRNSFGPTGYIHNGADDNASGVASLLELIEAVRALPQSPRRSILFALWDGEESGLLGSKHWAANPTLSIERIGFAFNVDMVGRLRDQMEVYGSRTGYGLRQLVSRQNDQVNLTLKFDWDMKANSDHHSFFQKNIPVLMFHTGLHGDYHRPSDDAHKLNGPGMEQVSRLLFHTVLNVANAEQPIAFRSDSRAESNKDKKIFEEANRLPTPRLGVAWASDNGPGLVVSHVAPGSAAQAAGIYVGDRILELNGRPATSEGEVNVEILAATEPVTFLRSRSSEDPDEVRVHLAGNPTRIGISWRPDAADQSAVNVTLVTPGSAADQAGLAVGDRIYAIAGEPFQGSSDLLEKLVTMPGKIQLTTERAGRVRSVTLPTPPPIAKKAE